jgi:hypothetical protein
MTPRSWVGLNAVLVVVALFLVAGQPAQAQPGPSCGYGGMMGGWGPGGPWAGGGQPGVTMSMDQAIEAAQGYVARFGNPDLELHEAMEFECNFYFIVRERSTDIGAFELLVSRFNGAVFPEPGPNMMWNTKYGHMGSMSGPMMGGMRGPMMGGPGQAVPAGQASISADQASQIAQQWLDGYQPGSTIEQPDPFYGYYTVHTLQNGTVSGMLSVNAYSGQVWYHGWHGAFIGERELG